MTVGVGVFHAENHRARKTVSHRGPLDGTTYFFYDGLREIEERDGSENVTQQYVWGQEYIDQLLMIRGLNGTWFAHQDEADQGGRARDWNVIALTTPSGDVAEEYQYQPYGLPQVKRHVAFGDSDADGDVDSSDNTAHTAALTTYNRLFDADLDGDVSNTSGDADKTAWDNAYNEPAASVTMVVPGRGFSPTGNPFLFTGRRLDAETGLYFYRFRAYHPTLKVFLQRDPLGYGASGPSLYQYVGGGPTAAGDPLGLKIRLLGSGSDIQKLLAEIQLVVPQVQLDADGYLKMEKPGDDATFSEWLLWMLIDQATTIAIKKGHIPEKDPHGNKLDPLSPGWTNPDNNVIMVDRSRINMRATGAVIGLWQVIFHELVHAFNNVKKTHDSENCVRWVENMIHRDYERRHPDKKVEDRELDSTDDCPDYEKLIMPPKKKPTEPDGKPPASGPSPKERPVPSVPPLPSRKKPQP